LCNLEEVIAAAKSAREEAMRGHVDSVRRLVAAAKEDRGDLQSLD
jgi:hypothetical protein